MQPYTVPEATDADGDTITIIWNLIQIGYHLMQQLEE